MVLHFVRIVFVLVMLAITVSFTIQESVTAQGESYVVYFLLIPFIFTVGLLVLDALWKRKHLRELSGLFFGLLGGLVIAYALSLIVDLVATLFPAPLVAADPGPAPTPPAAISATAPAGANEEYLQRMRQHLTRKRDYDQRREAYLEYRAHRKTIQLAKLLLGASAVFLCTSFVLQTKDDFRFIIPYVEFARESKGSRPLLLDTSAIIDGRIADIADTRVLESELVVPRFVLEELQAIADSDDKLKRNRGRRGLDVLNRLRGSDQLDVRIAHGSAPGVDAAKDVDAKLVALARHLNARIATNDYNLNKVAQLHGVTVININDLANALKPIVLPGEGMKVRILKPGEEPGQGVGYLEDGTMVVAEQGRDHIGEDVDITVTSVLQTSAGRMIFGRIAGASGDRRGRR